MDAVPSLDDAVALAAYVQTLVKLYADRYDAGEARPRHHRALVAENRWRAARFGLDAELVDLDGREPIRVPVAEIVRRTLAAVDADARSLGCEEELVGIERILREGNGAQRQLGVNAGCLDLVEVTRDLAATTASESALTRT